MGGYNLPDDCDECKRCCNPFLGYSIDGLCEKCFDKEIPKLDQEKREESAKEIAHEMWVRSKDYDCGDRHSNPFWH